MRKTVYISIGNSDDKLSQAEWARFVNRTDFLLEPDETVILARHGSWRSRPDDPWQNACWCVELPADSPFVGNVRASLRAMAREFGQDSIAWAEATTEFIGAVE